MTHNPLNRRAILSGLFAGASSLIGGAVLAQAPERSIRPAPRPQGPGPASPAKAAAPVSAAALVAHAKLGGETSFIAVETRSGKLIEAYAPDLALPPASVAKAVTTLYALDKLGPQHRYLTQVLMTGNLSNGQLKGDLILRGSGDPHLDTDQLAALAQAVVQAGVKEVSGRFLLLPTGLPNLTRIDDEQPDHVGYNPSISGLNLNFNRVHFEWKRAQNGYQLSMDARGSRHTPAVQMARIRAVEREHPLFSYTQREGRDEWSVAASALGKNGSRWLPVRSPTVYTGEVFTTLAASYGLRLPSAQIIERLPEGARSLAQHHSADVSTLSRDMLRFSTNITAEVLGLSSSGARSLPASGKAMSEWALQRYGVEAKFLDHSGLNGGSRISSAEMARALRNGRDSGIAGLLRNQPIRDQNGKDIKNHPAKAVAKTGTLNFASGLAGYLQPENGPEITFAIFSADLARRAKLAIHEREQPQGGKAWLQRARNLQAALLERWANAKAP